MQFEAKPSEDRRSEAKRERSRAQNDAKGTRNKIAERAVNLDTQNEGHEGKAKRSRARPDEAKPCESEAESRTTLKAPETKIARRAVNLDKQNKRQ